MLKVPPTRESWITNQSTVMTAIASWFHVTWLAWPASRVLRLLRACLAGSLCKLTPPVIQPWSSCSSSPIVSQVYPQAEAPATSLSLGLIRVFIQRSWIFTCCRLQPLLSKSPQLPIWPVLCPISFQTLGAVISSCLFSWLTTQAFQAWDVSTQGQLRSFLPKIPQRYSFQCFSGC